MIVCRINIYAPPRSRLGPHWRGGGCSLGGTVAQIIDGDEQRKLNWIQRIGKTLSARWSKEPPPRTTTVGIAQTDLNELYTHFFDISTERKQVYDDMDLMDDTVDEFAQALDVLADHAVMGEFGEAAFQVASKSGDPLRRTDLKIIESLLERTQMREKMFSWTRDCIKYGDEFLENVIGDDMLIHRLMHLPPKSMRRHETPDGLLQNNPDRIKKTGYAFTQVTEDGGRVVAAFLPFQITHLRWRRSGGRKYGRPQGYTARVAWRKLQALEEALVMNWLTRAFARLLFIIDTTGLAPAEAQKRIRDFQTMLQTTDVGSGKLGVQNMSIVKDIFIGKQFISDDRGEFTDRKSVV